MHSGLGHWRYRSLFYTTSDWGVTVHSGLGHWRYRSLFYTTSDWGVLCTVDWVTGDIGLCSILQVTGVLLCTVDWVTGDIGLCSILQVTGVYCAQWTGSLEI